MSQTTLAIDIGTSTINVIIAKSNNDGKINILGNGLSKSNGLNKGIITNIDLAGNAIKEAVVSAKRTSGENVNSAIVSISGSYTISLRGSGSIIVPNGHITEDEIKKVMDMALYNAQIMPEYEVIHVLPISFKVDDSASVDNPLNMNGSRLEVSVSIITAKKTALVNIENALKMSSLEVDNFILGGYASSISTLQDEERNFGTLIIDLGGSTTDITIVHGQAILYNDFIPLGSNNITNDLSQTFNTPQMAAEALKKQFATLLPLDSNEELAKKKINVPIIGSDNKKELTYDYIQPIIHARTEEILVLINEKIKKAALLNYIRAGIVLTGGMSKLPGIDNLAKKVFEGITVKIANVKNIPNDLIDFEDNTLSTIVGMIKYSLDTNPPYELDSNKDLRTKKIISTIEDIVEQPIANDSINENTSSDTYANKTLLQPLEKKNSTSLLSKIITDIKEWF